MLHVVLGGDLDSVGKLVTCRFGESAAAAHNFVRCRLPGCVDKFLRDRHLFPIKKYLSFVHGTFFLTSQIVALESKKCFGNGNDSDGHFAVRDDGTDFVFMLPVFSMLDTPRLPTSFCHCYHPG